MADSGTSGFQSLLQNPGLARYVWSRLLPAAYTVQEGIGRKGEKHGSPRQEACWTERGGQNRTLAAGRAKGLSGLQMAQNLVALPALGICPAILEPKKECFLGRLHSRTAVAWTEVGSSGN